MRHDRSPDIALAINHIRRLERGLRLIARDIESATGATAAQLFILERLSAADGLSLRELAQHTLTDRSSVSEVVDRLVASGFAARRTAAADKRRAEVRITAAGRRVLASAPTTPAQRLIDAVTQLSPRVRRQLTDTLAQLNNVLGLDSTRPRLMFEEHDHQRRAAAPRRHR